MAKKKQKNNDLQNTTQKTRNRAPRIPLKTSGEIGCSGLLKSSCFSSIYINPKWINVLSYVST